MNEKAARLVGDAFLRGFFDTIDALLATGMKATPEPPESVSADDLAALLERYPVAMHAMAEDGGRVGVLLSVQDALTFQAKLLAEEVPEQDELGPDDIRKLREVFEPCLSGGIGGLKAVLNRELPLQDARVAQLSPEDAPALLDVFDNQAFAMPFAFEDSEQTAGNGVMLGAQVLFAMVAESSGSAGAPQLSPEEMSDILSGFDAGELKTGAAASAGAQGGAIPPNLDMIMDIGLVCTARLGRVEMPIADILSLGPGSILEVGHLVDEPIELLVNDKLIARGDVVVVDERFGLRITEIVSQADRIKSLL